MAAQRAEQRIRRKPSQTEPAAPGEPRRVAYLYLALPVTLYATFVLGALAHGVWLSLFRWDGVSKAHWVGLANYRDNIVDPMVRSAFMHSMVLVVFYSFFPVALGLLVAVLLSRSPVKGLTFFRTMLFLPQVIAGVVIAITWRWIYGPDGPLNQGLRGLGLGVLARPWLGDFGTALPALGFVGTWAGFGFCMVLFLAALQRIPQTLYESARVDGAGPLREFFAISLPGIRNEFAFVLALTVIFALRTFDLIYVATAGGPGTSTVTPSLMVYNKAFVYGEAGSAASLAVMLAAVVFAVAFIVNRLAEERIS